MHNFRQYQAKNSFGGRGSQQSSDLPNSWMTEEDQFNMRRQNTQFHSAMPNMTHNMQMSHLNQPHMLSGPNRSYMNEGSCKLSSSNFDNSPNTDIFKSVPPVSEASYQNRMSGDRFPSNNSFSDVNMQYKMSDRNIFNDFSSANTSSLQSRKTEVFPENVSKPLYSNIRQPQERFACMQNDQNQFNSKYVKTQIPQGKGTSFRNDKILLSPNSVQYFDKVPNSPGNNFTVKPGYKAPSLFPAYEPKDVVSKDISLKTVQHNVCSSNFAGKTNSFCDKTPVSSSYLKPLQHFEDKIIHEDRNLEKALGELFKIDVSLKDLSNSPAPLTSFKSPVENTSNSNSKFSFSSENQQPCFQSPSDIPFQTSHNIELSNHSNSSSKDCLIQTSQNLELENRPNASSKDCLLQAPQNIDLSNHSNSSAKDCFMESASLSVPTSVHQNLKEVNPPSNCSFNFESTLSTSDIADLLPGIDAFLKESLNKSEEQFPKSGVNKSNSAFLTSDTWSKPSIPFIGDNQTSYNNALSIDGKDYCGESDHLKGKYEDKFELKFEKTNDLKSSNIQEKASVRNTPQIDSSVTRKSQKPHSALEEAIDMLVTNDVIVGLEYIIEYKKNINQKGSFPFKCKLCNSAITRPSIIDHIIGSKHRIRYLKSKDESRYELIIALKADKAKKDTKIYEAVCELEKLYGRGHVTVDVEDYPKDAGSTDESSAKESDGQEVFTLDKIPIGFEALSPEHDDIHSTSFTLDSNLNQDSSSDPSQKIKEIEPSVSDIKKGISERTHPNCGYIFPDLDPESCKSGKSDSNSLLSQPENSIDLLKGTEGSKDFDSGPEVENLQSSAHAQRKRSASSDLLSNFKQQKVNVDNNSLKECSDSVVEEDLTKVKPELSPTREKNFSSELIEELTKCIISSEEEASFALQAVNILIQMLLRYKLQHVSFEVLENMMRSLQSRCPDKIEELLSLLKDSKIQEEIEDSKKNILQSGVMQQATFEEKPSQEHASHPENSNQNLYEFNLATSNLKKSCDTAASMSRITLMTPQTPVPVTGSINIVKSKNAAAKVTDTGNNLHSSTAGSQISDSQACLKPPPFFNWPKNNETLTNPVSYTTVQGTQNMMWTTTPYQHTQTTQYAQIPYYQAQGYSSTFAGTQVYSNQFPVLQQSSVSLKRGTAPPLPPPPPPPPPAPAPCNPPLPPLPSPATFSSASVSHSMPLSNNPLSCLASLSNPPPPPPLP